MALAIGVKSGSVLHIGQQSLEVLSVHGTDVVVRTSQDSPEMLLSPLERRQVYPGVWISTAKSKNNDGRRRLVIEAPRSIKIIREEHAEVQ